VLRRRVASSCVRYNTQKRAQTPASGRSGGLFRRQIVLQAAPSFCQALRRPLSASDRAPGRPELLPASANQPRGPRWPGTSALFSTETRSLLEGPLQHLVVLLGAQGHGAVDSLSDNLASARRVRALDQRRRHLPQRARKGLALAVSEWWWAWAGAPALQTCPRTAAAWARPPWPCCWTAPYSALD